MKSTAKYDLSRQIIRSSRMIVPVMVFLWATAMRADSTASKVKQGNLRYEQKMYDQALQQYSEALAAEPHRNEVRYNLGNTFYRQGKYTEAATELKRAYTTDNKGLQAKAHYNLGNTLYKANDFQGAVAEYTAALKANSRDPDAKYNLELALRKLEEQQQQQQDKQDKDQPDDKKKEDRKSSGQEQKQKDSPRDQSKKEQDQQKSSAEKKQPEEQKQPAQTGASQGKEMDPKEAERLLQAMEAKERQEQLHQLQLLRRQKGLGKDW